MRYLWGQGRVVRFDGEAVGVCAGIVSSDRVEGAAWRLRDDISGGGGSDICE